LPDGSEINGFAGMTRFDGLQPHAVADVSLAYQTDGFTWLAPLANPTWFQYFDQGNYVGTFVDVHNSPQSATYDLNNLLTSDGTTADGVIAGTGNDTFTWLTEPTRPLTIYGNAGADSIDGGFGDDVLDGGPGADSMIRGWEGDDTIYFDNQDTSVDGGDGYDTGVLTSTSAITIALASDGLEALVANQGDDHITANPAAAAYIDGRGGNDTITGSGLDDFLVGGTGNDTVNAGVGTDLITGGSGTDTVNGEDGNDVIFGGDDNDSITGGAGDDVLHGDAGTNQLTGGTGNDSFYVDSATDTVTEGVGEGSDSVFASVTYTLPSNVEAMVLVEGAGAIDATGNSLANSLTGNSDANTLNGAEGADTMAGGAGDDLYFVDNANDVVTENAGEGNDTVEPNVSYILAPGTSVETLTLVGAALTGTGNDFANALNGTSGNNTLNGAGGADTMAGGAGDDMYFVDNADDVVTETAGQGNDTVEPNVSYILAPGTSVETLRLVGTGSIDGTGNDFANALYGNDGNNTLNGAGGADTMVGGVGNDIYYVDNAADVVTETAGQGSDEIDANVSYALPANVETLVLVGALSINATGNGDANRLVGNAGANTLDGGAGADTLLGGAGNDTYGVDNASDVVTENAGEGTDTVQTTLNAYTLGNNVEKLTFTGSGNFSGIGNTLDNTITGGAGTDTLNGGIF
jgi:Ca2+-binding RTX toxin-like protein